MKAFAIWLLEPAYLLLWRLMRRTGMILACSDAPDMTAVNKQAEQNAEISREQLALAREESTANRARQAQYDPLFKQLIESSISAQTTATGRSADEWAAYKSTWEPLGKQLADTATNFDTPARREAAAASATADVGMQFDAQGKALSRDLARSNITLGSGKALALQAGMAMEQAKAGAGAATTARRQVEQDGIALVDNAAKFGRNISSSSLASANLGLAAGQSAGGAIGQQQSVYNAGLSGVQGLYSGAASTGASAGGMLLGAAQQDAAANAAKSSTLGSAVGTGASLYLL